MFKMSILINYREKFDEIKFADWNGPKQNNEKSLFLFLYNTAVEISKKFDVNKHDILGYPHIHTFWT